MPRVARRAAPEASAPAVPPKSTFEGVQHAVKASGPVPMDWPPAGPIGDLMAAEAMLDLLRLAVEKDFAGDAVEVRQESAAIAAAYALRLVHSARLAYAEALAVAVSASNQRRPG